MKFVFVEDLSKYFQQPVNRSLASSLPWPLFKQYCFLLGEIYSRRYPAFNQSIVDSLEIFPVKLSPLAARLGVYEHYYEKLLMGFRSLRWNADWLSSRLNGSFSCPESGLLVTAHFGGVEYLPLALVLKGCSYAMLLRFKTKELKKSLTRKAEESGVVLVDAAEEGALQRLLKLSRKMPIITECDEFREWKVSTSSLVFLEKEILKDRSLGVLKKRCRGPALLVLMRRKKGKYYLVHRELAGSFPEAALEKLEREIRLTPEQWYQLRNWKKYSEDLKCS